MFQACFLLQILFTNLACAKKLFRLSLMAVDVADDHVAFCCKDVCTVITVFQIGISSVTMT